MGDVAWLTTEEVGERYGIQPLAYEFIDRIRSKLLVNGHSIIRCWLQDDVERIAATRKKNGRHA